ncbi:MAG: type III pantothenate kinase [Actinomycetia bacterium]|nr:type III pantothenate kinase [Actinomycetes bacterium]
MLLAIDIGNTQTSLGVYASGQLFAVWRLSTRASATPDELVILLTAAFAGRDLTPSAICAVCLCSVVPELQRAWTEACASLGLPAPLTPADRAPADLGLTPAQIALVGADRLANVVAARVRYGAPVVVVDFGTATNFDVVDAAGRFVGGPISAGLQISADALYARAARLTSVELAAPTRVIAQTTEDALRAGLVLGEAAKVDGLVARIVRELGATTAGGDSALPVVATGGLATLVTPHSTTITVCDPTLTLDGLCLLANGGV